MNEVDWSQKYRPSNIEDVILPEGLSKRLGKLVKQEGGLSLLFHGRAGCGKTTVARLINPAHTLFINCTADNSINMVRDLIRKCSSLTLDGGRRVILLDEADYLTKDAQAALRGEVESLSAVNDFVMTANEPGRLIEPILSRFFPVSFDFKLDEELRIDLKERLWSIAVEEGFTDVSDEQLFEIVDYGFPDMRRMVKSLQFQLQLA